MRTRFLILWTATMVVASCAGGPRSSPLPIGSASAGPNTVETVRRQFEGRWALTSLDVAAEDGRRAAIEAAGNLEMDAFGNLNIEYRLSDAARAALEGIGIVSPNPVISTTGRAAIDPQQSRITYISPDAGSRVFDPELAARRANPFALERARYYTIESDVLTLVTRYDSGQDAATSRWRRTETLAQGAR